MAILSLLGLYKYDPTIFENILLPDSVNTTSFFANLLAECGELEILYTDPVFFKEMLAYWSSKEFHVWEKLEKTLSLEYDPISNYDRQEEWEDVANSKGNSTGKVAGYNSEDLVKANGAETTVENKVIKKGRVHGNIGVTTTQEMIERERRLVEFNLMDYIIDSFKRRFCLLIY